LHGYIHRQAENELTRALNRSPAVAILGPRQCGKSTLAKSFLEKMNSVYLDLQDRTDRNKLHEPELFFDSNRSKLVCLDEIQTMPEFFSVLRSEIDRDRRPGRLLILGSASPDLIRQSSESLAGRLAYLNLSPFVLNEVSHIKEWRTLWLRGGFPDSTLANSDDDSFAWRKDFIRTFLERDIPALGALIPSPVMERLWRLLAHYNGQTLNYSKLAAAADLSQPTLKKYLAILEQTYMLRLLMPYEPNLKKRMIKTPKVYLRDSGILHALLHIETFDDLLAQPANGASFEGFAIENIIVAMPEHRPCFLRTSNGAEVDLIMERGRDLQVFEIKLSKAPKPSRGFYEIIDDLNPSKCMLIAPVDDSYAYDKKITVTSLTHIAKSTDT
jgi:predicted AAA+ superfamily ATPase